MKCFYHIEDLDGKCSGAIVKMEYPDCEMIGMDYGDQFPWDTIEKDEVVYMVDFSLQPFDDMERLNGMCKLIWIDHHVTAIQEAEKRNFRPFSEVLDEEYAACELTWQYIKGGENIPWFVYMLGRYDVWDHFTHPGSLEFQYGVRALGEMLPYDPKWLQMFDNDFVLQTIREGKLLLDYENKQNEMYARTCSFETEFDGLRCIACNKGLTSSKLFDSVYDPEKHDAMLSFVRMRGRWKVSMYSSKPEIDISQVCKSRGGGGHKGAAGFQCEELPFDF